MVTPPRAIDRDVLASDAGIGRGCLWERFHAELPPLGRCEHLGSGAMTKYREVRPRWSMDRMGRRSSLRYFRTSGPLPAKSFTILTERGELELVSYPPFGLGEFQPRRKPKPVLGLERRSGLALFLILVLVAFHVPAP